MLLLLSSFSIYIYAAAAKSLQSCLTLCDPMDYSLTGSSAHGIFQARALEWGAIAFSKRERDTHTHTHAHICFHILFPS